MLRRREHDDKMAAAGKRIVNNARSRLERAFSDFRREMIVIACFFYGYAVLGAEVLRLRQERNRKAMSASAMATINGAFEEMVWPMMPDSTGAMAAPSQRTKLYVPDVTPRSYGDVSIT